MNECKPLAPGDNEVVVEVPLWRRCFRVVTGRGLHSSTSQLNVSALCGTRGVYGVLRGCLEGIHGGGGGGV